MSVRLTKEQLTIVEGMMQYAQAFADQIYHIMQNHGLDKIDGCNVLVNIDPKINDSTECVYFGDCVDSEFGKIRMEKGRKDQKFTPVGRNSVEYELMFADEQVKEAMRAILNANKEKPLPPDGLWVGGNGDPSVVYEREE